jgi:tRNA(adenine34) deaminase
LTDNPSRGLSSASVEADNEYMREALFEAERGGSLGEVPVGAVVVHGAEIVGRGCNQPITTSDPTAHAEVVALRDAARTLGNYRLTGVRLYVTVEPCLMCVGALVHARVGTLIYGTREPKAGAVASSQQALEHPALNHRVEVVEGVLADESRELLQRFFQALRAASRSNGPSSA